MNEVTKIHLGRQSFTIAADAYKALQTYLHEIKHQAGPSGVEVSKEVELRMAELLAERGVTGGKVILLEDIDYLKQQLGEPRDFKDDDDAEESANESDSNTRKRLFRDTENGMLAGVAAGLAAYTGIPALIFRLLFVVLTFSGAMGILIYLLLWLLLPEAKTPSDHLQMKGLAVTVDSLKKVVEQADVQGAAHRAGRIAGRTGEMFANIVLAILGISFILGAFGLLAGTALATTYLLSHGLYLAGTVIFPLGTSEVLMVICSLIILVTVAAMFALVGKAMISRKWTFPSWAVAAIALIFICAAATGTALSFGEAPAMQARYKAMLQTQTREVPEFKATQIYADQLPLSFKTDDHYEVEIRTVGKMDTSAIKTTVKDGVLTVNASGYVSHSTCHLLCPYGNLNTEIVVHAPSNFGAQVVPLDGNGYDMPVPPMNRVMPAANE